MREAARQFGADRKYFVIKGGRLHDDCRVVYLLGKIVEGTQIVCLDYGVERFYRLGYNAAETLEEVMPLLVARREHKISGLLAGIERLRGLNQPETLQQTHDRLRQRYA